MSSAQVVAEKHEHEQCLNVSEFRRLKYFYGQMLSPQDMRTEQAFFREKLRLHNRCLHGYGVVCGLLVTPVPFPEECDADDEKKLKRLQEELKELEQKNDPELECKIEELRHEIEKIKREHCHEERHTKIHIECGLALDCEGNELALRRRGTIDLLRSLSPADYKRVQQGVQDLYISICYCEQAIDPVRPVLSDACGAAPGCEYGKIQESARIQVTVDPPKRDERCEVCCGPCSCEPCVLLAKIDCFHPSEPLEEHHIHNEVRRPVSLYVPTTITGISWRNGHEYTQNQTRELLGTHQRGHAKKDEGLRIHFSRPVLASTIHPGVMETWLIEGGRGRAGNISHKAGEFVDKPKEGVVSHIIYRDTTGETLNAGDRVLIILRASFILDECCRPVDGENIGGRVPLLPEYAEKFHLHDQHHKECCVPPSGYRPWRSGDGTPGGTFESWFYVVADRDDDRGGEDNR